MAFCRIMAEPGASTPLEHVLALAEALRDHLLASAPPDLAQGAGGATAPAGARKTKRKGKRAASVDAPEEGGQEVGSAPSVKKKVLVRDHAESCHSHVMACAAAA